MNDVAAPDTWLEANQAYLRGEFARVRVLVEAGADSTLLAEAGAAVAAAQALMPWESTLDRLVAAFGLSAFERLVLLLCAGIEMDASLRESWLRTARVADRPTFGYALEHLPSAHWSAITPDAPLRRWRLVTLGEGRSVLDRTLEVDERILHALAGLDVIDTRLEPYLHAVRELDRSEESASVVSEIAGALGTIEERRPAIVLVGGEPGQARRVAKRAAEDAGWPLRWFDARTCFSAPPEDRHLLCTMLARERHLQEFALIVDVREIPAYAADVLDMLPRPLLVSATRETAAQLRERNVDLDRPDGRCRSSSHSALAALAERVTPAASWDDVVLPEAVLAILHEVAAQVRQREIVHEQWGFARRSRRGLGVTALFAGESGTGKTMATEALANELGLELYRVDLSGVVSKYIGETEKNLRRIFDAAEDSGAILLFDEADALFGKRSEVRDSHDRYANIEVSYLLQRMEDYAGLALLTTNARSALDRAFQRRLRFVVEFPFPDAAHRERIWRAIFPREVPTERLDFTALARPALSGGTIRNVAINAAFRAAGAGRPVTMADLAHAARVDAAKRERPSAAADTRSWA